MNWLDNIKELGIKPPSSNRLSIRVSLPAVSVQSSKNAKDEFISKVHKKCSEFTFLLSGDVQVEIVWYVHEQERYETDRIPDVDNIIKPLLDGLSGPDGVLIDDNQVQSICCSWIDWTSRDEEVIIEIKHFPNEWVPRNHFQFVQFDKGLCYPIPTYFPKELQRAFVSIFEKGFTLRSEAEKNGAMYEYSRGLMPMTRVFHRTRVGCFPIISVEEFKLRNGEP